MNPNSRAWRIGPDGHTRAVTRVLLAVVLLLGACVQPALTSAPSLRAGGPTGPTELADVVRVVDGDTIIVDIGGQDFRLRYIGLDAPESVRPNFPVQEFGREASAVNARLVGGRSVVLEKDVSDTDRFGRLLRYVWLDEGGQWLMVNIELVRLGFAAAGAYPPDVKYQDLLRAAERDARDAGRGLWAP